MEIARRSSFASRTIVRDRYLSVQAIPPIAAIVDAAMLALAGVSAALLCDVAIGDDANAPSGSLGAGLTAAFLFVPIAHAQGLYRVSRLLSSERRSGLPRALIVSLLLLALLLVLLDANLDDVGVATVVFATLAATLVPAGRLVLRAAAGAAVQANAIRGRPAVVLGDAAEMDSLAPTEWIRFGMGEIARFVLTGADDGKGLSNADCDRVAKAAQAARELQAVELALVMPWCRERQLTEVRRLLRVSPLPVRLYPDREIRSVLRQQTGPGLDPCFSIKIKREPLTSGERAIKRAIDVALALAALILLSPLLLLVAGLVKLDSRGPAIFRQRRCGFDEREFTIFKFRTMTVMEDGLIVQAQRGDARVTRVGKILRRASIDELPQLLNVLRGEMSLVGPRPHAIAHDRACKTAFDNYALRHHVKPGLTGAAQVAGLRGETKEPAQMEQRVARDLWYIDNWSLALDLRILAQTCIALLRDDAY